MGVDIDKARRDQFAPGVDLFLALAEDLADLGDAAAGDGDIGFEQVAALAVGNVAAADHEVRGSRSWRFIPGCNFVAASSVVPVDAVNRPG